MSYASASDLAAKYPATDLAQLTDPAGQTVDTARLDTALADASDRIDGYLEGRYTLPLAKVPRALKHLCCDMAMYELQVLRPLKDIEDARKRNEDAIRFLERVQEGKATFGLANDDTTVPPTDAAVVVAAAPQRSFDRRELHGF
jgi:phage gp36-like protein